MASAHMRILYFSPHPTHDIVSNVGYSTHQREMIKALRGLGHKVEPVIIGGTTLEEMSTVAAKPSAIRQLVKSFMPPVMWRTLKDWKLLRHNHRVAAPRLEAAIKSFQPDFIYERSEYMLGCGSELAQKHGIPHIYEVNAPCVEEWLALEGNSILTSKARNIEVEKYGRTSALCPVSTPLADHLTQHHALGDKRVEVIGNAIDPAAFSIDESLKMQLRKQHHLDAGHVVVGFVGSILPYHGIDKLLESFYRLYEQHSSTRLMIVGDGMALEDYRGWVSEKGLSEQVIFTGKVPFEQVSTHISLMDICLNPRHSWYGSPIKLFEYAALGKAIVAPDQANIRDLLTHGETAHLIDDGPRALLEAVDALVTDKPYREQLAKNVQSHVLNNHTWEQNAKRVIELVKSLPHE